MKTTYKFEIERKKFWLIFLPLLIIASIFAGVAAYFVVDKIVMPKITGLHNKGEVTIPKVIGLTVEEAKQKAYDLGLRVSVSEKEFSDKPVGTILTQEPKDGKIVKKGHIISTIVSKGNEIGTVPSVKKLFEGPAKKALRDAGFHDITVISKFDDHIKQNLVIGTYPKAKTTTSKVAPIKLYVSKGPKPTSTFVPNITGEFLSSAKDKLEEANLRLGKVSYQKSGVVEPGRIIKQGLTASSKVSLESRVDVVVAKK